MNQPTKRISDPSISISRSSKKFCLFDGWTAIGSFESYTSEEEAIRIGKERFKTMTDIEPKIVYPKITKMRMST